MYQNRRQKVFNKGALHLCGGGLDILKIDKNSTNLQRFLFQFGGLGAAKHTKSPP